ncbi:hypothetical protein Hs30E_12710 [Lactococcus hodotermopsidis]|uniref:DNA-binding response regulator n=1 Tax=Pseudolactococcus hodotermopsidis TaxID=2709157 RepID=A0A6A0BBG2_9LACT|nr:response regulator [Lactococcus hodotermopsidis]GFH42720.1 hypothetical protein Hs30E_12710 [Lactococcus hodotermopsidis]
MAHLKVLIVDDELSIRAGIRNLINWEESGFTLVGEATNGRDALTQIEQYQPHIVLTDIIMPLLNGVELSNIIAKNYPEIQVIVLSSHDDFDLVKSSFQNGIVDYILKPTLTPESLLAILKQSAAKIKLIQSEVDPKIKLENALNQYLSGYTSDFEFEKLSDLLSGKRYHLLYSSLSLYKQPQEMRKQIQHYFNLIADDFATIGFITSQNDVGLLIGVTNSETKDLRAYLLYKIGLLDFCETHPFFTLSSSFEELWRVKVEFEMLKTASQNQRFYFKNLAVVDKKDLLAYQYGHEFDSPYFLKTLVNKAYLAGISQAKAYLNDLLIHTVSPVFLKEQTSTIFYNLFNVLENNKYLHDDFAKNRMTFIMKLNSCEFADDFSLLVRKTIESLETTLNGSLDHNEVFQEILDYIEAHFSEQITLTALSEKFHFSYNYLSSYFSTNYNATFSDYLKTLRMEKAKTLLKNSELNLSEISEAIGFSDLAYFSKVFKKEIGTSPSKYRRLDNGAY